MKSTIYIRADGNAEIGLGHLVRCLAFAQMLGDNFDIHFVCKYAPEAIIKNIQEASFSLLAIDEENDFLSIIQDGDIVVLDHYGLGSAYQKDIKSKGCILVCIDDLHDKEFYADLIINHAPGVKAENYCAQPVTQFALGLDYALLRPSFLLAARKERSVDRYKTVFICFGGADSGNLSLRCIQEVVELDFFEKIIVVIGSAYQEKEALVKITGSIPNLSLYHSVTEDEILELMNASDVAIVPASGILLEVLSSGCQVISGRYVDNQKYLYSQYKDINAFIDAGDFSQENLRRALNKLISGDFKKPSMHIDGLSNVRLLKLIKQLKVENEVSLRKADERDVKITFNWANDRKVRAFSFNQTEIKEHEHSLWFNSKIKDNNCIYLIATTNGNSFGSIRFDLKDNIATISYLIDPAFHGKGYGIVLLKKGIEVLMHFSSKSLKAIVGYVMPENIPSVKAFKRLGFEECLENNNIKFIKYLNGN